ncbi:MAG: ParB family protein [Candidatus Thiodiazotropha taylori]
MSKKQPTQEELLDKVLVGNFSNETQSNLIPQDGDTLILHPSQILKYDRNPRIVRNREYESIKRQLISQGFQEVLSVTQRPGMPPDQFMLARGANTRLEIIHEILEETSDERFLQIKCRYVVWVSEAKIFTDTMAENDVRGEVTFFDRAHAAMDLKAILEEQSGSPLGPTELIEYINTNGLSKVNRADLTRFEYTIDQLQEVLIETLSLGLGPWQIDAISKLHEAAAMLWEDAGETDDWDPLFQGILKKLDQRVETLDDWSYDRLFKEVARELGSNDTQGIERAKAGLEFVLETGQLPEKREYKPFKANDDAGAGEAEAPQTPTKPSKPKATSASKTSSPSKPKIEPPKTPEQTPVSGSGQGISLLFEETEEDPDDRPEYFADDPLMQIANTELEDDEALRGLVPDEDLIVDEEGKTHYRPKFPVLTDEQKEANTRANLEAWQRFKAENPERPELTPEQEDLMRRREAWLEGLQRDREESGRTRSTNRLVERAIVNLRPFPKERLHHDAYASARRICLEFFRQEMADHLVQPLTRGVGFYVSDWPRELPFEKNPVLAYLQLATWHWLVAASGQIKVMELDQLPQEILASPFGEIINDVFDLDNFDGGDTPFHRFSNAISRRVPIEPSMFLMHDLMLHAPLNFSLEQMIINRANYELNRRCIEKFKSGNVFLLESNWDQQYGDQELDSLNRFE